MKYSSSKENYLKTIFHLQAEDGLVTTNMLAKELQTRAASVTDMLKKLLFMGFEAEPKSF